MAKAKSPEAAPPAEEKAPRIPPVSHRELGLAILAACDPVEVGRALLESKSESVRTRALEIVAGWAYGPAKAAPPAKPYVRIVWGLLGEAHGQSVSLVPAPEAAADFQPDTEACRSLPPGAAPENEADRTSGGEL